MRLQNLLVEVAVLALEVQLELLGHAEAAVEQLEPLAPRLLEQVSPITQGIGNCAQRPLTDGDAGLVGVVKCALAAHARMRWLPRVLQRRHAVVVWRKEVYNLPL